MALRIARHFKFRGVIISLSNAIDLRSVEVAVTGTAGGGSWAGTAAGTGAGAVAVVANPKAIK